MEVEGGHLSISITNLHALVNVNLHILLYADLHVLRYILIYIHSCVMPLEMFAIALPDAWTRR